MIVINCTTEEYHAIIRSFDNSINCPFQDDPKIRCTLDYNEEYVDGEEEVTCIPCLKKHIVWIIED